MQNPNFSQGVSFITIPQGYQLAIVTRDLGTTGNLYFKMLIESEGRIVPVNREWDISGLNSSFDIVFVDVGTCKIVSLSCYTDDSADFFEAKHISIFLCKRQGSGGTTFVGCLFSQDVSSMNPISFPVASQYAHPTIFGTPMVIEGVVDFKIIEFTIPDRIIFHISNLTFKALTSSTVADRYFYVDVTQNGDVTGYFRTARVLVASESYTFNLGRSDNHGYDDDMLISNSYLTDFFLNAGDIVTVRCPNFELDDVYSDYFLSGEYKVLT
jgi:hypothetical protein